ncbi:hypothetical protein GGH12_004569 [Coemansia sp. RSA 1822]|nr:hypothetical protein LPJ76_004500 [Coemansia sp. RSA 638]KAJ2121733.1 hypothetical protein IW147_003980 [Coemansia sp. RSA 720]KAJ2560744.1 hypothetical protein GGH12_004569 [Coemansia sp. RSA 1822]
MVRMIFVVAVLGASGWAYANVANKRVEREYPQLSVHHQARAGEDRDRSAPIKRTGRRYILAPSKPRPMEVDASEAISDALMDPNLIVAGEGFSALLVSAIESNDGNMPVLSI